MLLKRWVALSAFLLFSCFSFASFTPQDIAKASTYQGVKLSPDGSKLAMGVFVDGSRGLLILSMKDFSTLGGLNLGAHGEVGNFYWGNNERIVFEIWRRAPWQAESSFYGELYAVNYDGSMGEIIYGVSIREKMGTKIQRKKQTKGWAHIINLLPDNDREILISSEPQSQGGDRFASVHKLDIYSGTLRRQITRAPAQQASFFTDKVGNLVMSTGTNKNGDTLIYRYQDDEWVEVSDKFGDSFRPIAMSEDATQAIYFDDYEQDKVGLFKMNLATGERKEIYTDDVVSLTQVNVTTDNSSAYAIRVDNGRPAYLVFDGAGEEATIFKSLLSTLPGYSVSLVSRSKDGGLWVIYASNDIDAGTYYLYDKKKNKISQLFANMDHIDINDFSESQPVSFEASDGMTIHGFITYPVGQKADQKVPLVTLVHGGPHGVRDYWSFDREVQLLANQGYAVLQVNYRGSGGYGNSYQQAGYKHWGDTIQQDIIDGTRYILEQGKTDPDKVCIMGTSFGGYSAVMSAELAPDLFKCAVATAGVYDLNLMYSEGDIPELLWGKKYLNKAIGSDEAQLAAFSPVNHVSKLAGPVLISHGEKDRRVPIEHAERLKAAMDKAQKPYEWFVESTETHGFYDENNRAQYYQRVIDFLAKSLK
ncbi:S9 family peptidase [Alteromonas sp. 14N.309.X.WAT.G.H12]|uniref:S9 family peptidase n=1 Tax=Alteromonas sp. 14N.309.X.WAT.G.H12 TaxID=3120824 RepID=UPI002FD4F44B